jgi:hypothetical protein
MEPNNVMAPCGNPKSDIIAISLAWSMDPKAFVKSMNNRYISWVVNLASFSVAMRIWICLLVYLS